MALTKDKTIVLDKFRGIDETSYALGTASYCKNLQIYGDYNIKTRPSLTKFGTNVFTHAQKKMLKGTVSGVECRVFLSDTQLTVTNLENTVVHYQFDYNPTLVKPIDMIEYNGEIIILLKGVSTPGNDALCKITYTGGVFGTSYVDTYTPTITTATPPTGGGTPLDQINLISQNVIQSYVGNGTDNVFTLALESTNSVKKVTKNGIALVEGTDFVRTDALHYTLTVAPANDDDVDIEYSRVYVSPSVIFGTRKMYKGSLGAANILMLYGNPSEQNTIRYSEVSDKLYFTEFGYSIVGDKSEAITGVTNMFSVTLVATKEALYPLKSTFVESLNKYAFTKERLNTSVGHESFGELISIDNKPMLLSNNKINMLISTDVPDERVTKDVSKKVSTILDIANTSTFITLNSKINNELFMSNATLTLIYNYALDVFYTYDLGELSMLSYIDDVVYTMQESSGILYKLGESLHDFTDTPIVCEYLTNYFDAGYPEYKKNTHYSQVTFKPNFNTYLDIGYNTNSSLDDKYLNKPIDYTISDFDDVDYDDFTFLSNTGPQTQKCVMTARGFNQLRLILKSDQLDKGIDLVSIKIETEII